MQQSRQSTTADVIRTAGSALVRVCDFDPLREVQYDIWWRDLIAGPTQNDAGAGSNDFPGIYFFEPRSSTEYCLFFDGAIDWRVTECGLTRRGDGVYVGFWSEVDLDGEIRSRVRKLSQPLDHWDALIELMRWSFEAFPDAPDVDSIPDYWPTATAAMTEAQDPELSLLTVDGVTGHRTYVANTSEVWRDAVVDHIELFTQATALWPLRFHLNDRHLHEHQSWYDHLVGIMGAFYNPALEAFSNTFPLAAGSPQGGNVITTREQNREATLVWLHIWSLAHLLETALISQDVPWMDELRRAVDRTVTLARANRYHFPLFWWLDSGEPRGGVDDFGCAGTYAWLMLRAADLFGDDSYAQEAAASLRTLRRLPFDHLYAESTLLPRAAWAANELALRTGEGHWRLMRDGFTAAALRMLYWRDPHRGMFNACAGMNYPAIFENVGNFVAFEPFLDDTPFPLRAILGHQLLGNDQFFDRKPPAPHIPIENLATTEYPFQGAAGKEIYGLGAVLWLPHLRDLYVGPAAAATSRRRR
ncbi:MAG: hypothetical protein H0V12_11725 [Chloroflexi bacterium]|nr:hypothetical protein [Chloroflexota bacterium]